ncbi:hypothetical protein FOA43_000619 [Brettanomyces nanus]|uniref:Phosphoribosylglycinamide formyltransferase n=1 Tax=Eeniella nana TaxID=13502 RepID=A0A875S099_EENNA|nr:uncharacterized protein FOA43_000619 [Brettanomyces nanus]QPG73309.1 hypothetical protein FOA43_000619 [Brettanomyces nanus]
MSSKPSIIVLISGSGTNLQALIDNCESGRIQGHITHVISSSAKAYGLERAAKAHIPTTVHRLKEYYQNISKEDKEGRACARGRFNKDLGDLILSRLGKPSLIVCAGWMLILSNEFLKPMSEADVPIINLHPALPGAFEGTHAIERSWEAGQQGKVTKGGCMIHYVIQEVDKGEPLIVKEIPVIKGETVDDYETRIHSKEHAAIVEGTVKVLNGLKQ